MSVEAIRNELAMILGQYALIRDAICGEPAIKGMSPAGSNVSYTRTIATATSDYSKLIDLALAKRYLPQPNAEDQSDANQERYRAYVTRAVWYGATGKTLEGLGSQIFKREPVVEIPAQLEVVTKDADGTGIDITQLAMRAVSYVLPHGRGGIFIDYPPVSKPSTIAELAKGDVRPVLYVYAPWNIINWRTKVRGAKKVLSMVVLREDVDSTADEFETKPVCQYRVLRLDENDQYYQETYRTLPDAKEYSSTGEKVYPKDASGKFFNEIPFHFIGSKNNDETVDDPPFYDLASLNIAHYRNSADYEESAYQCGQPTVAMIGITQEWLDTVFKGTVPLGARAAIPLPTGADIKMVQASPNTLPGEAMDKKERQMVALGAKLVQQAEVQRTATDAMMDNSGETSVLANVSKNVSTAFEWALKFAYRFISATEAKIRFELNKQFELNQLSADDQSKLIALWQKGAITFAEMRSTLRKAGTAYLTDEVALTKIKEEQAQLMPMIFDNKIAQEGVTPPAPSPSPNPNPRTDPSAHATRPATRGA